jgi:hypothetical protein
MFFSHNIPTSLCCCNVDLFITSIIILKYNCKPIIHIVVKKLFVVSTYNPWAILWIRS